MIAVTRSLVLAVARPSALAVVWAGRSAVVWAVAIIPIALHAQEVRTSIDTTRVTVGDRIVLSVDIDHAPDERVVWPDSLDLAPFEVLSVAPRGSGADFHIAAFELGELEVPSFEIAVEGPDGTLRRVRTDRFGIEVVSVGTDESGDIREIRGPLAFPVSIVRIGVGLFLLLLAGIAGWFLARRFRGRRGEPEAVVAPAAPPRPAHEVALEALDRLAASALLERGEVKEFHVRLSEILRRYVEGRYRVPALELTTSEILSGLGRVGVGGSFADGLRRILDRCDLVKFAKVRPEPEASRHLIDEARRLIESSSAPRAPDPRVPDPRAPEPVASERG